MSVLVYKEGLKVIEICNPSALSITKTHLQHCVATFFCIFAKELGNI